MTMHLRRLAVLAVLLLALAVTPALAQPASDDAETVDTVLLASTANYPDALVAAAAGNKIGAPVLLTDQGELPQQTRDALSRLDPSTVVVVGGPAVVSDPVIATLESDYNVTRLWGTTRYGTAVAVAEHFWIEGSDEAVLVQNSFQDQNGSVLAAAKEIAREDDDPIYLTPEGGVPASVLSSLQDVGVQEVTLIGRTVSAEYRSSLTDIGISIDEEITAATDRQVREAVRDRVVQQLNATTDLLVVASSGYRQSIATANFPDAVGYHITSEDDLDDLVQVVTERNVSSVRVTGRPDLAEDAAERLRDETDAEVHLVVARASEAVRLNANLTTDDLPAFARAHQRKVQAWEERRAQYLDRVQQRANHSLTRAQDLVDENASEDAREELHDAQVLYSQGHYVEAHEAAREAISEVHAADYERYRDNATALQERVQDEVSDLQERVDELQELNREFAAEMQENLTAEERLEIIEEFRDKRREQIRELIAEAQELGRTDARRLHERVQDAEHRLRDRSADGRFEARLACTDREQTRLRISGHDGYVEAEGVVALSTPNYRAAQQTSVDRNRSRVTITITFTERDGAGVQCLGAAKVERRVRVDSGNWTVQLRVAVNGDEVYSDTQEVTVTRDDDETGEHEDEVEDENETEEEAEHENGTNTSDDAEVAVPTSFRLESTDGDGCDTSSFYYDGRAVEEIAVRSGTQYTVTFAPRESCTYSGGAQFYSDPDPVFGESDAVQGGETTSVRFNATEDFVIEQWWPNRGVKKAELEVDVR